ncbi:MAG: hypothetical protein EAX96_13765 [Candidatus Lokiarchaeota archaeon]|nr:hypothetical protein [Candidatus Lokiarchaeota archaeon]
MINEGDEIYEKLRQHFDQMPINFPATESKVEIRLLKHFFTPEEAKIVLCLGSLPEKLKTIYRRAKKSGFNIEEVEKLLDGMVKRGVIQGGKLIEAEGDQPEKGKMYCLSILAVGMHEFNMLYHDKEYYENFNQYVDETFYKNLYIKGAPQMRMIPIEQSITPEHNVSTYDNIKQIIKNIKNVAVAPCICKKANDILENPCKKTDIREICFIFSNAIDYVIDIGYARKSSKDELLNTLKKAEEIGLVIHPNNCQDPLYICLCCSCCCSVLSALKRFPNPAEYFSANFQAIVDTEKCSGCETCIDRCQMEAITIIDKFANVNHDRCIGCGLCVPTCPSDAIKLQKKEIETVPPESFEELALSWMRNRDHN